MKTFRAFFVLCSAVSMLIFSSCDKGKIDVNFNVYGGNIYLVVDTTSMVGNIDLAATTFSTDLNQKLKENSASMDDIESISLNSATFTMENPGTQNFDIVERAYAFISSGSNPETQVAFIDPVPDGITEISLTTSSTDLKTYLEQSVLNFRVSGFTSGPNVKSDTILVNLRFRVEAKIEPS